MNAGPIIDFGREVLHLPAELLDLLRLALWSIVAGMWTIVLGMLASVGTAICLALRKRR